MPVEERGLTSGALLEETNSQEIGFVPINSNKTRRSRKELYLSAKMAMFSESRPSETEPSCAGGRSQSESRVREIRTHGSMSGSVETEHGAASEAPADERAGKQIGYT